MREGHAILALVCALATASLALAAEPPVEFSGLLVENGQPKIALTDKANNSTQWLAPGEDFLGYRIDRYDAKEEAVFLKKDGQEHRLSLALSKTADTRATAAAPSPAATTGTPDSVTTNAIRNNLRQFVAAARRHQAERGATRVAYADVVGPGKYLADFTPIAGENYSTLTLAPGTTVVSITTANGGTITTDTALTASPPAAPAAPAPAIASTPPPAAPVATPAPTPTQTPDAGEALAPTGRQPASPNYMIKGGDTWETISQSTGVPVAQLKQLNPAILEGSAPPAGQTIRVR